LAQGGKVQAPCLKITHDNTVEWLYESGDIIDYLDEKFGKK
jgi:glutathione S-transferase